MFIKSHNHFHFSIEIIVNSERSNPLLVPPPGGKLFEWKMGTMKDAMGKLPPPPVAGVCWFVRAISFQKHPTKTT